VSLFNLEIGRTSLQTEVTRMVRMLAVLGLSACAFTGILYGITRGHWLDGALAGLTMAISMIPEEFPVVLTVFLALPWLGVSYVRELERVLREAQQRALTGTAQAADQAIELSGLKIGQTIDAGVLDAAAATLLQSGLFKRLGYSVHSPNGRATVTFAVEESAIVLPVAFENFVWFSDEEMVAAIRRDVPFFNGSAPAIGDTTDKITNDLQRLLNSRNITGHVESFPNVTKDKLELVFTVKGAKIPVCVVRFPGAAAIPEAQLMQASRPLLSTEYSRKDITAFIDTRLTPLYRRLGHLRAEFQPLKFTL
jgi:hypothetical protein